MRNAKIFGSNSCNEIPPQHRIEQHSEDSKKMQLSMAQKATALQQIILISLLNTEEEQRNEKVK